MSRLIGGFLPLRLPAGAPPAQSALAKWVGPAAHVWLLHNARSALYCLWSANKPKRVWLPSYVCEEVAKAVPLGIYAQYYPLDEALLPCVDFLSTQVEDGDHVLAVDYLGRPPGADFVALVRARPEVGWVEDRAQALDPGEEPWGNWVLYSPRKLFGVPDGGILVARHTPLPTLATRAPVDLAFVLPSLERFEDAEECDNQRWYTNYVRGESAMTVGCQQMSRFSLQLLKGSDAHADSLARRKNYSILDQRLRKWAFFQEAQTSFVPLGFPVRVRSAAALSNRLAERGIFAARHWSTLPSDPSTFASEHRLANELLTLPCDYRYGEVEMHRVADTIVELMSTGA